MEVIAKSEDSVVEASIAVVADVTSLVGGNISEVLDISGYCAYKDSVIVNESDSELLKIQPVIVCGPAVRTRYRTRGEVVSCAISCSGVY